MPRNAVCAGGCGKIMKSSGLRSLPDGQRMCQPCRRAGRGPAQTRDCTVCGATFRPTDHRDRRQLTCSRQCGAAHRLSAFGPPRPAGPIRLRTCEVCGGAYRATYGRQRTCGRACGVALRKSYGWVTDAERAKIAERERRNAEIREACRLSRQQAAAERAALAIEWAKRARRCRSCEVEVEVGRWKCDACKAVTERRQRRAAKARRRRVAHEPYTLEEIAQRDRYRCGLCRKRVAMTKRVPHPKAPTIDHVLPIAAGGDDTRANIQLAHFECNWRKADGGTQQLALVG